MSSTSKQTKKTRQVPASKTGVDGYSNFYSYSVLKFGWTTGFKQTFNIFCVSKSFFNIGWTALFIYRYSYVSRYLIQGFFQALLWYDNQTLLIFLKKNPMFFKGYSNVFQEYSNVFQEIFQCFSKIFQFFSRIFQHTSIPYFQQTLSDCVESRLDKTLP